MKAAAALFALLLIPHLHANHTSPRQAESTASRVVSLVVVGPDGNPVEYAEIRVWGYEYIPPPKPNLPDIWYELETDPADMSGETTVSVARPRIIALLVLAMSDDGKLAGKSVIKLRELSDSPVTVTLTPTVTISGTVVDYHTEQPVSDCRLSMFLGTGYSERIDTGQSVMANEHGQFTIKNALSDNTIAFRVEGDGVHTLDDLYPRLEPEQFGRQVVIRVLSSVDWEAAMEAARLNLPALDGLDEQRQFEVLSRHHERWKQYQENLHRPDHPIDRLLFNLRVLPTPLYQELIRDIAQSTADPETQFRCWRWIYDSLGFEDRNELAKVVQKTIESGMQLEELAESLSAIRSFHAEPDAALLRIYEESPHERVRGNALKQLVHYHSTYWPWQFQKIDTTNLAEQQGLQRDYLERLANDFAAVQSESGDESLGEFAARQLQWLDAWGIQGFPPDLSHRAVNGDTFSLHESRGKLVVIEFLSGIRHREQQIERLNRISDRYADQLIVAAVLITNESPGDDPRDDLPETSWPVIHDEISMNYDYFPRSGKLYWGDQKLTGFRNFGSFVINEDGQILAVGLGGDELEAFIDQTVAAMQNRR